MILVRNITYPAFTGKEKRKLYIYLPLGYEYEPDSFYPVLYMFDGHNCFYDDDATFGKSWGVGKYLDEIRCPLIVVGLESHRGCNNERLSEYSPYDFYEEGVGNIYGCGKETMDYIVHQLKPYVDKRFRTLRGREHTFIAGSSMGGLMACYAALRYNRYFSKAAALSPAIFLNFNKMKKLVKNSEAGSDTTIYLDFGSDEINSEGGTLEGFAEFGACLMRKGIAVNQRIVPGGDHSEASWERQLPIVIDTLMYGL